MWHPKFTISDSKHPTTEGRGIYVIYWYDRPTRKYNNVSVRHGVKYSKEKAYELMLIKRGNLLKDLTFDHQGKC